MKQRNLMSLGRRALKAVNRTVGPLLPPGLLAFRYEAVPGRIHVDDQMFRPDLPSEPEHYVRTGREAVALMQWSLQSAGLRLQDVTSCLLLPSGYGRVVRHLAMQIEPGRITACDIDGQAVRFCAHEFGVRPLRSYRDLRQLVLTPTYDLIFVGSLLTHLPPAVCLELLQMVAAGLRPSGHLVFTTQGESCLDHLSWYGHDFRKAEATFREHVFRFGVAFAPYPRQRAYGITIHAQPYVKQTMAERLGQLRPLGYKERGWDAHQDVWSYCRR